MKNSSYLPEMAGEVAIRYHDGLGLPERSGTATSRGILRFPYRKGMTVHKLMDGKQLLVHYPGELKPFALDAAGLTFFAGQDEQAFITAVDQDAVHAFNTGGETAFYDILKPGAIKEVENILPHAKAGRQGDIWYIRLPVTWKELRSFARKKRIRSLMINGALAREARILGTRHLLDGKYVPKIHIKFAGRVFCNAVGEGVLTAPDHTERDLTGMPHMLVRTKHIAAVNPRELKRLGWD